MEGVRKLVPRTPPEGFLAWAADVLSGELDTHGFLYEQEWVEDCGLEVLLDEYARPRKRRMVRVQCSCCGYHDLYHYGRGAARLRLHSARELHRGGGRDGPMRTGTSSRVLSAAVPCRSAGGQS